MGIVAIHICRKSLVENVGYLAHVFNRVVIYVFDTAVLCIYETRDPIGGALLVGSRVS